MRLLSPLNLFQDNDELRFKLLAKSLSPAAKTKISNYEGTIYAMCIGSSLFCFRPLTYGEFNKIEKILSLCGAFELENFVLEKCLVWPETADKMLATYPGKLTKAIIEISGWNNKDAFEAAVRYSRLELRNHNGSFDILLRTQFGLKQEDLLSMDFLTRSRMIAWAEILTNKDFLEQPKKKKGNKLPGLGIDSAGLEGAIQTQVDEVTTAYNQKGKPAMQVERESTVIYNTKLSKRDE